MCVFESKKYLGRTHGIFSREEQLQFEETAWLNGIKWGKTECRRATCKRTLKWALHGTLNDNLKGIINKKACVLPQGINTDINKVSLSAVIKMRENAECGRLGLLGVADRVKRAHCSSEPENNEDCL